MSNTNFSFINFYVLQKWMIYMTTVQANRVGSDYGLNQLSMSSLMRQPEINMMRKIKVLIVDDYEIVRQGLAALLKNFLNLEVVGATGDGRMVLPSCKTYQPDVVLMEMKMLRMNGVTVTGLIRAKYPNIQVVILSDSADETLTSEVFKAGAISYLLKTGTINEVAKAIQAAYYNKSTLAPEAVTALISASRNQEKFGSTLTIREREVLAFMVNGLNNISIAEALSISRSTVKNHISNMFSKLAVGSRTKVVALAVQHKLYAST